MDVEIIENSGKVKYEIRGLRKGWYKLDYTCLFYTNILDFEIRDLSGNLVNYTDKCGLECCVKVFNPNDNGGLIITFKKSLEYGLYEWLGLVNLESEINRIDYISNNEGDDVPQSQSNTLKYVKYGTVAIGLVALIVVIKTIKGAL